MLCTLNNEVSFLVQVKEYSGSCLQDHRKILFISKTDNSFTKTVLIFFNAQRQMQEKIHPTTPWGKLYILTYINDRTEQAFYFFDLDFVLLGLF